MDRGRRFGDTAGRGVTVAIIDSGVEADHPGHRRTAHPQPARRIGRRWPARRGRPEPARPRRARNGLRRDHPCHRARLPTLVSIRVLGADNRGAGRPSPRPSSGRSVSGFGVVNLEPVVAQRGHGRAVPRAGRRGLLRQHAPCRCGQQRDRRVVSVAVRGGRVRGGARRPPIRTSGSTTRRRPSNSGPTASTSTSPGEAAHGSARRATRSPRRILPVGRP